MRTRHRLGLPLLYGDSGDQLDTATRDRLEDGLLDACREVGLLLLRDGAIREGWMYLRPVGDKQAAVEELERIAVTDDNLDAYVEVALHEGVDAKRGFAVVLDRYGTCNAITTFEAVMPRRTRDEQQQAAGMLVERIHGELMANVRADVARKEGAETKGTTLAEPQGTTLAEPQGTTLAELVTDRPWLFGDNAYHIDTSHLSSIVRFARLLDDERLLRLALDLTQYGRRLCAPLQYHGEEPFVDAYPTHALYFRALLGDDVEAALAHFRDRAENVDHARYGTAAIEVYVDLLSRLGRYDQAIEESIRLTPPDMPVLGLGPSLVELSRLSGNYQRMLDHCRIRNDLLGYAVGLLLSQSDGG
jgi:hypothetical protein